MIDTEQSTERDSTLFEKTKEGVEYAWNYTYAPFTIAYAASGVALAYLFKTPEPLMLTAHGAYETAIEVMT